MVILDSIVSRLSEIERAAAAIVENAQSQTVALERDTQEKRNSFDARLEQQTKDKIEKIQAQARAQIADILAAQEQSNDETLTALNDDYENNHERYAQEIFKRIIEV